MELKFVKELKGAPDIKVIGVYENKKLTETAEKLDHQYNGLLVKALQINSKFKGKPGDLIDINTPERILLVGLGKKTDNNINTFKLAGSKAADYIQKQKIKTVLIDMAESLTNEALYNFIFTFKLKSYAFDKYLTQNRDKKAQSVEKISVVCSDPKACEQQFSYYNNIADGVILARDLVTEPSNVLTTAEFAERAKELSKYGLKVTILEKKDLEKLNMNLHLAVGSGSVNPPKLAVIEWKGKKEKSFDFGFIGKGVCFDAGGVDIKPAGQMYDMKSDMGGAGTVMGIMYAAAKNNLPMNIVGVLGLAENMPDGAAYKSSDIIKSASGLTVEIKHTDAEGRLVLADSLWYVQDKFKPKQLINFATLTGAVIISLGHHRAGLMSNNDAFAEKIFKAGESSGEKVWKLPLEKEYDKYMDSKFADVANIGNPSREAGSITAAQFLKRFVNNDSVWAHLDIAGTAWIEKSTNLHPKGRTGYGVILIHELLKTFI
jgi:leucyl aminopeptidase